MKDEITLQITEDGTIRSIYADNHSQELNELLGAKMVVERASHVEWEEIDGIAGWTVRAAWDPDLAIRDSKWEGFPCLTVAREKNYCKKVHVFATREEALKSEVSHFWALLPPKEE